MSSQARSLVVAAFLGATGCVVIPLAPAPPIPQAMRAHPRGIRSLAFSGDGRVLLSASQDGPVILWDVDGRQPIGSPIVAERRGIHAVALSPDAVTLAVGHEDGTVALWDTRLRQRDGSPLPGPQGAAVTSVAFSPDGLTLASASKDGTVVFWDVRRRVEIERITSRGKGVGRVLFSPDGSVIAVAISEAVTFYDGSARRPLAAAPSKAAGGLEELAFSPDGKLLARTGGGFALFDVATRRCVWGSERDCEKVDQRLNQQAGVAFSPDSHLLAVGPRGGEPFVKVWSLESREQVATLKGHGAKRVGSVFLSSYNASAGSDSWTYIHAVAFSPDGKVLATGGDDRAIILWDVESWKPIGPSAPPAQSRVTPSCSSAFALVARECARRAASSRPPSAAGAAARLLSGSSHGVAGGCRPPASSWASATEVSR